jgi:hypothetical protein
MAWKNTIAVFQTAGEPPSEGKSIFATIGSSKNSRNADRNDVSVNNRRSARLATADNVGSLGSSTALILGVIDPHP